MALDPKYYNSDNSPKWLYSAPGVPVAKTTTAAPVASSTPIGPTASGGNLSTAQKTQLSTIAAVSTPKSTTTVAPVSQTQQKTTNVASPTTASAPVQSTAAQPVASPGVNPTTYTLSSADMQYLNPAQQATMIAYKKAYAEAQARNDQNGMSTAATGAVQLRTSAGYTANADGTGGTPIAQQQPITQPITQPTAQPQQPAQPTNLQLSAADTQYLTPSQQSAMVEFKKAFAAAQMAGDQQGMDNASKAAQSLRQGAGYTANADGSSLAQAAQIVGQAGATPKLTGGDTTIPQEAQAQILQYKMMYEQAKANGDQGAMAAAADGASKIRALYGYSAGSDGSGYTPLGTPTTQQSLNNLVTQFGPNMGITDNTNIINAQYEALRAKNLADLAAALDQSKGVYNQTISAAQGKYAPLADQASVQGRQNLDAIREQMAGQGLQNTGENITAQVGARAGTQNAINNVNVAKATEIADAQRQIDALQSKYAYDQQSNNATVDGARLAALLAESNRLSQEKWGRSTDMIKLAAQAEQLGLTKQQVESTIATDNIQRIGLQIDNALKEFAKNEAMNPDSVENQVKMTQLWTLKQQLATANEEARTAPEMAAAKIRLIEAQITETYSSAGLKDAQAAKTSAFSSGAEGGSSGSSSGSSGSSGTSKSSSSPKVSGSYTTGNSTVPQSSESAPASYPSSTKYYGQTSNMLFDPLYTNKW